MPSIHLLRIPQSSLGTGALQDEPAPALRREGRAALFVEPALLRGVLGEVGRVLSPDGLALVLLLRATARAAALEISLNSQEYTSSAAALAPSSSDESDRGTPAASPATDALRGLLARHRRRAVAARPRSLCRLVAAGCFLVAVLALSGVGAAFLSYHVLGPRVVRAYNIIVHDEL